MLTAIKGYYENGQITLAEQSPVTEKTEVVVIFLHEQSIVVLKKRTPAGSEEGLNIPDDSDDPLDY